MDKLLGTPSTKELKRAVPLQNRVLQLESTYCAYSDAELRSMTDKFRNQLSEGKTLEDLLPDAFAVCREAAARVLNMRHFPVQIIGGIVLHHGKIAEMKTGEGKTLVATLPAYLNALTGEGVHVITVNDYLARRDSEWMGKVHEFLGLKVGLIAAGMKSDERRASYAADITYGTNNEFGFDYLRDNMVVRLADKTQRGHAYAIVDEVDSILIDEARTPLIISGRGDKSTDLYVKADDFAKGLKYTRIADHDNKQELEEYEGDCIVDEKARSVTLTEQGIARAQRYFGVENLADSENMTLSHHINQAIRARSIMQRDVDYVVRNGEVIIVDEFTGRLMIGRRYSEGLHQAIEAKEHVHVAHESRTLATITFQNYFRIYKKLSGMTGTAMTEQEEFTEIYGLESVEIPTNKPMIRQDHPDTVYKTERAKYTAVIEQVAECHAKGQPVLVGTVSIEKSELLSKMLSRTGIRHEVLNAKHHEREAAIVAQAGKPGAVTIATNMAGRGTDIMLGGNPEFLAKNRMMKEGKTEEEIAAATSYFDTDDEKILALRKEYTALLNKARETVTPDAESVRAAGGLYIIGTERHESRRIDNQLRGRSGRQGDPGESRFFLSLEDDLMRLFGGEKLASVYDTLKVEEDLPIESRIVSGVIESSQKKVEGRNFGIRKNLLSYDDVINHQRTLIYAQRDEVLSGADVKERILGMIEESIEKNVALYLSDSENGRFWNLNGLRNYYLGWLTTRTDLQYSPDQIDNLSSGEVAEELKQIAFKKYEQREAEFTPNVMRDIERLVLLRTVDSKWMDHIDAMDELRKGVSMRGYAQKNPVIEYRMEGYNMFDEMIASIREETAKHMFTIRVVSTLRKQAEKSAAEAELMHNGAISPSSIKSPGQKKKPGRNDPCPCGSGKKYKNCCGRNPQRN